MSFLGRRKKRPNRPRLTLPPTRRKTRASFSRPRPRSFVCRGGQGYSGHRRRYGRGADIGKRTVQRILAESWHLRIQRLRDLQRRRGYRCAIGRLRAGRRDDEQGPGKSKSEQRDCSHHDLLQTILSRRSTVLLIDGRIRIFLKLSAGNAKMRSHRIRSISSIRTAWKPANGRPLASR
jgi:hypothetical protein